MVYVEEEAENQICLRNGKVIVVEIDADDADDNVEDTLLLRAVRG